VSQQVIGESANRGEPAVPRGRAIPSRGLGMVEERHHAVGADMVKGKRSNRPMGALGDEDEEQAQRVAVSADSVLARTANTPEVNNEEALDVGE
jgi:hypothetical protein